MPPRSGSDDASGYPPGRGTPPPRRPARPNPAQPFENPRARPADQLRGRPAEPRRRPPEGTARAQGASGRARPGSARTAAPARKAPVRQPVPAPRRWLAGKVAVAVLSATVLVVTGYYQNVLDDFSDGLNTADVTTYTGEKPADGAVDILMVGIDSRTDAQGNPLSKEQLAMLNGGKYDGEVNTDTLIVIRIPNDGGKAVGISIPRDSYVDIPGFGKHKINSAYGRAKAAARQKLQKQGVSGRDLEVKTNVEGAKSLIGTIEKLTGAGIDHYAEVNLLGFYDITNAIGGIDVCLNKAVEDEYSGANFPAGRQNLSGAPALAFVRQRHGLPNGDLDRITRQQVFMSGMAKKVLSQEMLVPGSSTLEKLQAAIKKSVVLDPNWNVMQFAQQMMNFTGGNLSFETIPHGTIDLDTDDGKAIKIDPDQVRTFVKALIGGAPPASSAPGTSAPSTSTQAKATVTVLNASGRTGLAADVAKTLEGKGFTTGETGNATTRAKTAIRYAKGDQATGQAVADALGGDFTPEQDTSLTKGKVTVLIGKDFPGGGERLAGTPLLRLAPAQDPGPVCVN